MLLLLIGLSLHAFPVYDINRNAADYVHSASDSMPYILQDKSQHFAVCCKVDSPPWIGLRLFWDKKNKKLSLFDYFKHQTAWETSKLTYLSDKNLFESEEPGKTQIGFQFNSNKDILLKDRKSQRYVMKRLNGEEIFLPKSLNEMTYYSTEKYQNDQCKWLFVKTTDKTLDYAFVDMKGEIIGGKPTSIDASATSIEGVFDVPYKNNIFILYSNRTAISGFVLLSKDGSLIAHLPNIGFYKQFKWDKDYCILCDISKSAFIIVDLNNGAISAEIHAPLLAIAEKDSSLRVLFADSQKAYIIDVKKGILIQDFTRDLPPSFKITEVMMSAGCWSLAVKGINQEGNIEYLVYYERK